MRADPVRHRCVANVNDFVEFVARDEEGNRLKQAGLHRRFQAHANKYRFAAFGMPREHGKTSQIVARIAHRIGCNPEKRFKLLCAGDTAAKKRVKAIIRLMRTPDYRRVFPDIHIESKGDTELLVRRESGSVDPTLEGYGIMSSVTGGRCDELYPDDVVDAKQMKSKVYRESVKERFWDDWMNLLTPNGRVVYTYTPWHVSDLSAEIEGKPTWHVLKVPVELDAEGRPLSVWDERWPTLALEERASVVGSSSFARGFRLLPVSDEDIVIKEEWWTFYDQLPERGSRLLGVDLAISQKNSACYRVFVYVLVHEGIAYIVDAIRGRWSFPEQKKRLKEFGNQHGVTRAFVESVAYQQAMADALKEESDVRFGVQSVFTSTDKYTRASELAVYVENARVRFPADPARPGHPLPRLQWLYDEMNDFPFGDFDDGIDATGFAVLGAFGSAKNEPRVRMIA